jgi:hypothetical protein
MTLDRNGIQLPACQVFWLAGSGILLVRVLAHQLPGMLVDCSYHQCLVVVLKLAECVEALHDMPQGARRITPHPQDSQATERVRDQ